MAEHAAYPEALVARDLVARYVPRKNTLEVEARVMGVEGGRTKKVLMQTFHLGLPDYGVEREIHHRSSITVFDEHQLDMEALRAAETVALRVRAEHPTTDADFNRRVLELDEVFEVALERRD